MVRVTGRKEREGRGRSERLRSERDSYSSILACFVTDRCIGLSASVFVPLYRERECCLLVLNSVTSTPHWIRQPKAAWGCVWCLCAWCLRVSMCSDILGSLSLRTSGYASSGTLAFSLRRMPPRPAADDALTQTGSSAALHPALLPLHGPISFTFLPRLDRIIIHYIHLQ